MYRITVVWPGEASGAVMRQYLTTDQLVGACIVIGSGIVFFLDMSPLKAAADGAAYGLVIALSASFGRRAVLWSVAWGAFLTILGPILGAERDEDLLQIFSGRILGLTIIILFAVVLLRMIAANMKIRQDREDDVVHQLALSKITRLALAADKSLIERFHIITENTAAALGADRACIAAITSSGEQCQIHNAFNRRTGIHASGGEPPACFREEFRELMANDYVCAAEDVELSPLHRNGLEFYRQRNLRAVLHIAAPFQGRLIGSIIISQARPHRWNEREITFVKSVAQIVALIFTMQDSQRNVARLDYVSQGIFVLNAAGNVVYANKAARELSGAVDAQSLPQLPFALSNFLGDTDHHDVQFDGREFEVYRTGLPDNEILIRIRDVTARNAALADAQSLQEQLKESAKLQAMGQLAAGIAHDFNNILSAIMGFTQALAHKLDAPSQLELSNRILGVCKKGRSLTEEILGFARTSKVERNTMDLRQILDTDLDVIPEGEGMPAMLEVDVPEEVLPVYGNASQLLQLVQNLVVNAQHACEGLREEGKEGHIVVSAGRASRDMLHRLREPGSQARILGTVQETGEYCYLKVADNGHGIAPQVMERMFEPFFTTKGRNKGSGLGLAVVHGVVDSHHGCCHVRSVPGEGTVFTIYLPLYTDAAVAVA